MDNDLIESLDFEFSLKPSMLEEFSDYILDFEGYARHWEDADDEPAGYLKGHRIDLVSARKDFDLMQDLLDCISPEISDLGKHIIRNNHCYIECCSKDEKEETDCASIVYIDEIMVKPEYRSRGIGRTLLKRMSQTLDMNRSLVALKAYPIADDHQPHHCDNWELEQLESFYKRLGFRNSAEHYMVKDARDCYAQRTRSMNDSYPTINPQPQPAY